MSTLLTPLGRVRWLGLIEGWSFLLLLLVAMPMKYALGIPLAVTIVGAIHGMLFLAFWAAIAEGAVSENWPRRPVVLLLISAVLPGGPFWAERRILPGLRALERDGPRYPVSRR